MIKKLFFLLLLILPFFITSSLYSLDKIPFLCPIQYKNDILIRSDAMGDGFFASPRNGRRIHKGIDLLARVGTPIFAAQAGRVIAAKANNGMGKYVTIRHRHKIITIYGHLDEIFVKKGDFIRQGAIIGSAGKTGNAKYSGIQPHLHFEVRKKGIPQDPLAYL